ncbi:MAG: ATP-binding protein [Defluviitaleaceae bacterium]|nr:ATP-binding protein [Defluviitaleaceae bacterium]
MNNAECIKLSFPVNPAYVSSARLTVSSIANRVRFDIDEIEDIKTAVQEACIYIIKRSANVPKSNFEICFTPGDKEMHIEIVAEDNLGNLVNELQEGFNDEMSLMMIKALVDEFAITKPSNDKISIVMHKKHKEVLFSD